MTEKAVVITGNIQIENRFITLEKYYIVHNIAVLNL